MWASHNSCSAAAAAAAAAAVAVVAATTTVQAARLEVVRSCQLYPYSCDNSAWPRPAWASYSALMSPQLAKQPWVAAWDRLLRVLLRLELRSGGITLHSSALREAFDAAAGRSGDGPN